MISSEASSAAFCIRQDSKISFSMKEVKMAELCESSEIEIIYGTANYYASSVLSHF